MEAVRVTNDIVGCACPARRRRRAGADDEEAGGGIMRQTHVFTSLISSGYILEVLLKFGG